MHIFKYISYLFNGAIKILFFPFSTKKYFKNKDKYSLDERYSYVSKKIEEVFKIIDLNIEIEGKEYLNDNDTYLFVPNHQSVLDALIMFKLNKKSPYFVCKKELENAPIVGKIISIIDSYFLDRSSLREALKMTKLANDRLKNKTNVIIFPEGTRSKNKDKSLNEYKAGAFKCAYGSGCKILPIVINGSYKPLTLKTSKKADTVYVKILKPIPQEEYETLSTAELALKVENDVAIKLEELKNKCK